MSRFLYSAAVVAVLAGAAPLVAQDAPARPAELVKLEAEAAIEIPAPMVPAGRAPEARKVAETTVAVRRAEWVVQKLLPPPPEGVTVLKLNELTVGARGWVDVTGEVVKVHEGMAVVRPALTGEGITFAVPATTDTRSIALRGEYAVDRAVTIDGREVLVLKEVAAAPAIDPARAPLLDAARKRLEQAKAEHARAVGILREVRTKAEQDVTQKARKQAEKEVVIPKDAPVEEQVKIRAKQQELALKLAKEDLAKITALYGDPLPTEPGTPGARKTDPGIPPVPVPPDRKLGDPGRIKK
jgi:hypothetical protein